MGKLKLSKLVGQALLVLAAISLVGCMDTKLEGMAPSATLHLIVADNEVIEFKDFLVGQTRSATANGGTLEVSSDKPFVATLIFSKSGNKAEAKGGWQKLLRMTGGDGYKVKGAVDVYVFELEGQTPYGLEHANKIANAYLDRRWR